MRNENFGQALSIDRHRCSQPLTANHALILLLDVHDCLEMTEFAFTPNEEIRLPCARDEVIARKPGTAETTTETVASVSLKWVDSY